MTRKARSISLIKTCHSQGRSTYGRLGLSSQMRWEFLLPILRNSALWLEEAKHFVIDLSKHFTVKDLGTPTHYLGIKVNYDRKKGGGEHQSESLFHRHS